MVDRFGTQALELASVSRLNEAKPVAAIKLLRK